MQLIHIDPTKHFKEARADRIRTACGIIPAWWFTAVAKEGPEADAKTLYDALVEQYPFYMGPMEGGTVDAEGVYTYPEDEPLYPLVSIPTEGGTTLFIYQYSIVAVRDDDNTFITRMD